MHREILTYLLTYLRSTKIISQASKATTMVSKKQEQFSLPVSQAAASAAPRLTGQKRSNGEAVSLVFGVYIKQARGVVLSHAHVGCCRWQQEEAQHSTQVCIASLCSGRQKQSMRKASKKRACSGRTRQSRKRKRKAYQETASCSGIPYDSDEAKQLKAAPKRCRPRSPSRSLERQTRRRKR